ncbi:MAG: hypothetical protein N2234_10125, partial [Planctomycetota bacterium]|nr:hypothetical protein [Planctomycetota bacterium]
ATVLLEKPHRHDRHREAGGAVGEGQRHDDEAGEEHAVGADKALRLPSLIIGLKGDWRSLDLHEPQTLKASLNYTEASPGEVLKIRAGLLHSLLAGTLVFEVSSNSDITYRLYDWGREGREMHEEKALSSLSTAEMKDVLLRGEVSEGSGVEVTRYVTSICTLEQIDFLRSYRILPTGVFRFGVVIWGTVECEGVRAERGDSFFIPACASSFEMIADEPSRVLLVTP